MRTPDYIKQIIEDALARLKLSAAQITDQLPGSALPPGGPARTGYPPIPQDHTFITDFEDAVEAVVGSLPGGFVDPMTATGDLIYRDSSGDPAALPIGTDGQVLTVASGLPEWADPTGGQLPQHASCWHDESVVVSGGTLSTNNSDGGQRYATYSAIVPPTNGDAFAQIVVLDAGNYALKILGYTDADQGQVTWTLGATTLVTAQDWYSSGGTYNVVKTVTFTLATAGRYALAGTISGKNASSSGYVLRLTKFWIVPS